MIMITTAMIALLGMLMAAAVWYDTSQRRLPNGLVLATLVAGTLSALASGGWPELGSHALHGLLALALGLALYTIGWIGAGDAKFYTAVAMWFPLSQAIGLLVMISGLGLIIVLAWLSLLAIRRKARGERLRGAKFPLGVPIAIGAFVQFSAPFIEPLL